MFATLEEAIDLLPKGIGWISWCRIKQILAIIRKKFTARLA
jgi:hypothetical protein